MRGRHFRHVFIIVLMSVNGLSVTAALAQPVAARFVVERYEVIGINPLSEKNSQQILSEFVGEHEGLEGVQAAVDALESQIRQAGHSFHRVILPPQTLVGGVIKLEVVEFSLGNMTIQGNEYFDESNILRSLPGLQPGQTPNTRKLSRQLNFANQHPAKKLNLSFRESEQKQAIDAIIEVEDKKPGAFFTALQNTGTDETGEIRLTVGYQHTNLFNKDHNITVLYTTAEESGAVQQIGLNYQIPFYSHAGRFSFNYSDSDVETGQIEDFFQISGKGTVMGVNYHYDLPGSSGRYKHSVSLGYDNKLFENDLSFDNQAIVGSGSGDVRTNPLNLSYQGTVNGVNSAFSYSLSMISNQPSGSDSDTTAYQLVRENADPEWSLSRYALAYDFRFAKSWLLRARYSGQEAGEPLVPGEQYGLGGANSVRGYEERSILGDNGWQANLEVWAPAFFNNSLYALIFYDTGEADYEGVELVQEPSGAGLGLRWNWNEKLSVRADLATALEAVGDTEDGDTFLHVSAFYRF